MHNYLRYYGGTQPFGACPIGALHSVRLVCSLIAFSCSAVVQLWQPRSGSVRQHSVSPAALYSVSKAARRSGCDEERSCSSRASSTTLKTHGAAEGQGAGPGGLSHWPSCSNALRFGIEY